MPNDKAKIDNLLFVDGVAAFADDGTQASRTPPATIPIASYGKTAFTKGGERDSFDFCEADADKMISDFNERKKEGVIDYEHQTLKGDMAPAAGWINRLEKVASGVVAHVNYWTEKAMGHLKSGEYRYFSPVFHISRRRPFALHSVALTNHPAIHGIPALVASDEADSSETETAQKQKQQETERMKTIMESLGLQVLADDAANLEAVRGEIVKLKGAAESTAAFLKLHDAKDLDTITGKIGGMVPAVDKAALEAKLVKIEAEKLVAQAFTDHKLVEAQRAWAIDYACKNLKAFADFAAAQPVVVPAGAPEMKPDAKVDPATLIAPEQKEIWTVMGLSDDAQAKLAAELKNKENK